MALREIVKQELEDTRDPERMLMVLEEVRIHLRRTGRTAEEDAVLEVMDFVSGWSSPHVKL
jgi:hypothetical protein